MKSKFLSLTILLTSILLTSCEGSGDEYRLNHHEWEDAFDFLLVDQTRVEIYDYVDGVESKHFVIANDENDGALVAQQLINYDTLTTIETDTYYVFETSSTYYEVYEAETGYEGKMKLGTFDDTYVSIGLKTIINSYKSYFSTLHYEGNGKYSYTFGTFYLYIDFYLNKTIKTIISKTVADKTTILETYSFDYDYDIKVPEFKKV